ncbi:MAG: chromosomal replication initiator protein DnaA [Verrucomicrobiota bacterium]|jgi:chromosomal replication initiator protein|nr:chromosomal replication initiator protein DnaA [Verrucomicrobiota bacterium]MDP6251797.1 chromosomal replication initiator protein DnaA [Verrucomicrobiota bacterium]MDP7178340.1 chromosomal replication initiator protein DnaA [Verrucomicrobiota bacterium]MDP7442383.1 chromosomal replication initiator protein DnaA [Verrucomicrobiota bacterium]HJN81287.1 chromosomal replication initiator protein DnaA [Verrucomicrobiota bacterium]
MTNNFEKTWMQASETLRTMVNPDLFNLWFDPIQPGSINEETAVLIVPNEFCAVWLKDNYLELLQDVLAHVTGKKLNVQLEINENVPDEVPAKTRDTARNAAVAEAQPAKREASTQSRASSEKSFNPKNTFSTFVVGDNNNFAHAAALAVAQSPGRSYNPLFLYGGVGLGKTHLLHAIGHNVLKENPKLKVSYLSSEKFTNKYIDAIQNNELAKFRRTYRKTDVLLIDDIQFLSGKERIQEEFFHTFNALHEAHKQIVMTCDRPANEIKNLEHRLVSRFEWGLVTDMQPPDFETRLAILRKKADSLGVEVPDEVVSFLAKRIRTNIRRLEGALIRVSSYQSLTGKPVTPNVVEGLLKDVLHEEGRTVVSIENIQKRVAEHYDIRFADMTSRRRPENIAFPRQIAMYLAREMTGKSLNSIGEAFGGRDHGTVLHACRLVRDRMEQQIDVRQAVRYLEGQIGR